MITDKGNLFSNYGKTCFIIYKRGDLIKLSYIDNPPYIESWSREDFEKECKNLRFIPMAKPVINRVNITEHLIEYELNLIGKTTKDINDKEKWFDMFSMNINQYNLFKGYAIPTLRKIFKFNKAKANSTFDWFWLMYGFKLTEK